MTRSVDPHKEAAGKRARLTGARALAATEGVECASHAGDLSAKLLGREKGAVDEEALDTGADELRQLRSEVDGAVGVEP